MRNGHNDHRGRVPQEDRKTGPEEKKGLGVPQEDRKKDPGVTQEDRKKGPGTPSTSTMELTDSDAGAFESSFILGPLASNRMTLPTSLRLTMLLSYRINWPPYQLASRGEFLDKTRQVESAEGVEDEAR